MRVVINGDYIREEGRSGGRGRGRERERERERKTEREREKEGGREKERDPKLQDSPKWARLYLE